jgi:hypothetical protein
LATDRSSSSCAGFFRIGNAGVEAARCVHRPDGEQQRVQQFQGFWGVVVSGGSAMARQTYHARAGPGMTIEAKVNKTGYFLDSE